MAYLNKMILAGFQLVMLFVIISCSSSTQDKEETVDSVEHNGSSNLKEILEHPQLYVNQEVVFEGVIESVEVKKINDDLTLLTVKMTPVENGELLKKAPVSVKFQFIEKLRQFEDLFTAVRYKNMRIQRHHSEMMKEIAYDIKIEANKIEALAYYFEGMGKGAVSKSMLKIAEGYKKLGDAYFNFQKAALESSPGTEARYESKEKEEIEKFESNISKGGALLLDFSSCLSSSKELILDGHFSFDCSKALNSQKSAEILTYSSLLNAESWEKSKVADIESKNISQALAKAVKDLGEGDKLVNDGMHDLGKTLDKTAIELKKASVPTIKCAYYGYNGQNLKRCAKLLKQMEHFPVGIQGTLLQSDLREEVNVMWVKVIQLSVDGMLYSLDYGDESGTLRKAVDFYEWAESVEKGN